VNAVCPGYTDTPLVAGAAAIVRQFLGDVRQHFKPGEKPSSALVKAILINGAVRMKGQFAGELPAVPNSASGFGRASFAQIFEDLLFDDDQAHAVGTGEMRLYNFVVKDLTKPFKLTMVWTDAPAAVNFGGLTNKLYLQLVAPGGQVQQGDTKPFPNAVNPSSRSSSASRQAGRTPSACEASRSSGTRRSLRRWIGRSRTSLSSCRTVKHCSSLHNGTYPRQVRGRVLTEPAACLRIWRPGRASRPHRSQAHRAI